MRNGMPRAGTGTASLGFSWACGQGYLEKRSKPPRLSSELR